MGDVVSERTHERLRRAQRAGEQLVAEAHAAIDAAERCLAAGQCVREVELAALEESVTAIRVVVDRFRRGWSARAEASQEPAGVECFACARARREGREFGCGCARGREAGGAP